MKAKKKHIFYCIILMVSVLFLAASVSYTTTENIEIQENQEYGKAYEEWLKLPEEEKEKTLTPRLYDIDFNSMELKAGEEQLEERYNLAEIIDIEVGSQGSYGLCWAFAATKAMETNLAITTGEYYDFSEMYLGIMLNEYRKQNGNYDDSIQKGSNFYEIKELYESGLTSGPVLESEIPYNNSDENMENAKNAHVIKKVKDYIQFPTIYKDTETEENIEIFRKEVKNHIKNYGAIYASIKIASTEEDFNEEDLKEYFNSETNALYYNGEELSDHSIAIVGWDDNYSKDNFAEGNKPEKDGAYIALNSWGNQWGNNGYFYISYEDVLVEQNMNGFIEFVDSNETIIKEIKNTNSTYEMKKVNEIKQEYEGEENNTLYILNYMNIDKNIRNMYQLDFWACEGANVEIYIAEYDENYLPILGKLLAKNENCEYGLNTVKFEEDIDLTGNLDNISFIIKYTGEYIPVSKKDIITSASSFSDNVETLEAIMDYVYPINTYVRSDIIDMSNGLKLGNMTPENKIEGKCETFSIPVTVEDVSGLKTKVYKNREDVTDLLFTINLSEDNKTLNITNNTIEKGEYLIEISYKEGKPAYKVINIAAPFEIESTYRSYNYEEQKWVFNIYIAQVKKDMTIDNITIFNNENDVTNMFENTKFEKWSEDYIEVQFQRELSENFLPGEYEVIIKVGDYEEKAKFEILEDKLIRLKSDTINSFVDDNLFSICIKDIETEEVKILDWCKDEEFLELEKDKLYEIKLYENLSSELIKQNYHAYEKIYLYKDSEGKKYFKTTEDGENLEEATMGIYNADGTEMENRTEKTKCKIIYDVIQLKKESKLWNATYNTLEFSINREITNNSGYRLDSSGITKKDFYDKWLIKQEEFNIIKKDGTELQDDEKVGTGMKIKSGDEEWTIICHGDIDGSGEFSITDISKQKENLVGDKVLVGEYEMAADYNMDGKVSVTDLSQMKSLIVSLDNKDENQNEKTDEDEPVGAFPNGV